MGFQTYEETVNDLWSNTEYKNWSTVDNSLFNDHNSTIFPLLFHKHRKSSNM